MSDDDNGKLKFEPKILMFACNWCSYSGLDLAGTSRIEYPSNAIVLRTMCSSRVDPTFVMKAFQDGIDGVIISMCHPGDCHYIDGNYKTMRRFMMFEKMMDDLGIDKRRLKVVPISASEAKVAQKVIIDMVENIKSLGSIRESAIATRTKYYDQVIQLEVSGGKKNE